MTDIYGSMSLTTGRESVDGRELFALRDTVQKLREEIQQLRTQSSVRSPPTFPTSTTP